MIFSSVCNTQAYGGRVFKNVTSKKKAPSQTQDSSTEPKAPAAWSHPKVKNAIKNCVLYHPIAHPDVLRIPIQAKNERLVDLKGLNNPRIRALPSIDARYQEPYPEYSKVRDSVAKALEKMLAFLPQDVGIAYEEGYRPLWKQEEYFTKKLKEIYRRQEQKDLHQAYQEACRHVSPFINNVPTHCTGAAIDMTLFSLKDTALLDMGKLDTVFGPNDQEETFSPNTTETQKKNRLLLAEAATKAGFVNYGYEWWHYSLGDRAWAFVLKKKSALYDIAEKQESSRHKNIPAYLKSLGLEDLRPTERHKEKPNKKSKLTPSKEP